MARFYFASKYASHVGNVAIEAKSTAHIARQDLRGLKAIAEEGEFPIRIAVCREPRPMQIDGIDILPAAEFVKRLWADELVEIL